MQVSSTPTCSMALRTMCRATGTVCSSRGRVRASEMSMPGSFPPRRETTPGLGSGGGVGPVEHLDRVVDGQAGGLGDVPATGLGVADDEVGLGLGDLVEQGAADVHGDLVLLLLDPVGPGRPAAAGP